MATKKIQIEYDINGKPIDVAIDKTLNLSQRVKELTKELRRTKEGTDEFRLLSNRLGEAQDGLAKTTAKSKDLFGSLSMLPGPIGMFFQELSGTIELLKIFSSFSMKDLSFQLGEVADDIGDIGKNLVSTGAEAANVAESAANIKNASSSQKSTDVTKASEVATTAQTAATLSQTTALEAQTIATEQSTIANVERSATILENVLFQQDMIASIDQLEVALGATIMVQRKANQTMEEATFIIEYESGAIEQLTKAQIDLRIATMQEAAATETQTTATTAQTAATGEATVATRIFSTALKLIPFLAIIAAITALIVYWQDLVDLITGATNVTKAYGEAQQGATKDLTEFNKKVYEQTNAIKQAKAGVTDKKEALKKYNDTLGSTIGYAKDLDQAERLMAANTKVVIEGIRLRAMANIFYAKAAEASAKAVSGEGIKPTFWENTFNLLKSGNNMAIFFNKTADTMVDNLKDLNQQTKDYAAEGDKLTQQALENDKKLQKGIKKPTEAKGAKADPLKEAQDKINANEALQQSEDELAEAQRKRSEQILDELKKEQEYKDKENEREKKRLQDLQNLLDVFRKKRLISQKEYDKQTQALQTESNNLEKTYQADKIARELKTQDEITKINALNATERAKLSEMERDIDAKSQKESLARTIEEIQNSAQAKIKAYDTVLDGLVTNGTMTMEEHNAKIIEYTKKVNEEVANETDKAIKDDLQKRREANLKKLDDELRFLDIRKDSVRENTEEYFDILREINDKAEEREIEALDKSLMSTEEYEKRKADIVAKYAKQRDDIRKQENRLMWQGVAQTIDALASISGALASGLDEESKKSRKAFEERKKLQVATAIMSAASGVIQILAQPSTLPSPFDWIVKAANVVALGVATAINIDKIKSTTFESAGGKDASSGFKSQGRNYGDGGMIEGPLHSGGGVPITAEGGEAVMTRGSVAMFAPLLSAMNQMGGGTSFSKGAAGQAFFDNPKTSNPVTESQTQIIKTYVVSNELTSEVEKQARLKALSTI